MVKYKNRMIVLHFIIALLCAAGMIRSHYRYEGLKLSIGDKKCIDMYHYKSVILMRYNKNTPTTDNKYIFTAYSYSDSTWEQIELIFTRMGLTQYESPVLSKWRPDGSYIENTLTNDIHSGSNMHASGTIVSVLRFSIPYWNVIAILVISGALRIFNRRRRTAVLIVEGKHKVPDPLPSQPPS